MIKKLKEINERLLDLGKRNNLINFKETKQTTLKIHRPEIDGLYNDICNGKKLEFYNIDKYTDSYKEVDSFQFKPEECMITSKEILAYKKNQHISPILKKIRKKANETIQEKGLNILYLAFGFLKWKDFNSNEYFESPLVLVPVKLEYQSALKPITISQYEDECMLNSSLKYKIENDYNIKLPEIEHDQSILSYLISLNSLIKEMNWEIVDDVYLGLFSFSKIDMYIDLKNNQETILKNPNIKALLGGKKDENSSIEIDDTENKEYTLNCVADADSSQLTAIEQIKTGKSFILEGPPGTGKSQTITNMIAESLALGKRVLFVSEKLAALNVVFNNLKKAGLQDYCLELHSNKIKKKEVIQELNRVLNGKKYNLTENVDEDMQILLENKNLLDDYTKALHKNVCKLDMTAYDLYGEILSLEEIPDLDYFIKDVAHKDIEYFKNAYKLIIAYQDFVAMVGEDYHKNEWYGYTKKDVSLEQKQKLEISCQQSIIAFNQLISIRDEILKVIDIEISNINEAGYFAEFCKIINNLDCYHTDFFKVSSLKNVIEKLKSMSELSAKLIEIKNHINEIYDEEIYKLDANTLHKKFKLAYSSGFRFLNKEYKQDNKTIYLCQKNSKKIKYNEVLENLGMLVEYHKLIEKYDWKKINCQKWLDDSFNGLETDYEVFIYNLNKLLKVLENFSKLEIFTKLNKFKYEKIKIGINDSLSNLGQILEEKSWSYFNSCFDESQFDAEIQTFEYNLEKICKCYENIDRLNTWVEFEEHLKELRKENLVEYIEVAIENDIQSNLMAEVYKKKFYIQWLDKVINESKELSSFNRVRHDKILNKFIQKDKQFFNISKAKINHTLSNLRPEHEVITNGSHVDILLREGIKKRRHMPIRVLMQKMPELILRLKPCFLMSPLSVSTFLDNEDINFDVVIFDEASQIYPQDAIGSIYRAKQVIIVGDSKQMPPTNFFKTTVEDNIDEDDYEEYLSDYESILDMCRSKYDRFSLKWHYRSRHEDLIYFSNKNFYNNKLISFPSINNTADNQGVEFYFCEDGIFDRSKRINQNEAQKVAQLVFETIKQNPDKSLGVVAFSTAQQEAIEEEIAKLREKNVKFEEFFNEKNNDPFFIKNLETVQGDERDIIIFSIAYAKDKNGRFYHLFGPLSREGGERRLNVAVTRAKFNIKVVSSIKFTDIKPERAKSKGALMLRDYLEFAEHGKQAVINNSENSEYETFTKLEDDVYNFLVEKGYNVIRHLGNSGQKIDLAIKHPDSEDYFLAIELDGKDYIASNSTRDRDRLRREILEKMGWNYYRIWSTNWFKSNEKEKKGLLKYIKNILKDKDIEHIKEEIIVAPVENDYISVDNDEDSMFEAYKMADDETLLAKYNTLNHFKDLIMEILKIEAPISEKWLCQRVKTVFGREKMTVYVKNMFNSFMLNVKKAEIKNGFIYLKDQKNIKLRIPSKVARPLDNICKEEIMDGFYHIIKENSAIKEEDLYKGFTKLCGHKRFGEKVKTRFENILFNMVENNQIKKDGDLIMIKEL